MTQVQLAVDKAGLWATYERLNDEWKRVRADEETAYAAYRAATVRENRAWETARKAFNAWYEIAFPGGERPAD